MADIRVARLAKLLTEYCVDVQPGDRVAVLGSTLAEPLMLAVQREILLAGGHPHLMPSFPEADYNFFSVANDDQLGYVSPFAELAFTEFEGLIQLMSSANTKALNNIDPARQGVRMKAMTPLMKTYMDRAASKEIKWAITMFPTHAFAQDAEMSLTELEDFVYATTYTDTEDPVGAWRRIHEEQEGLVEWLEGKEEIVVKGPEVDLKLSIKGRSFINADGVDNMPSGEIFTSPIEDSVEGTIRFSYPAIHNGREVEGVELTFEHGKVVKATARKNEAYLIEMLKLDEGASVAGEFAIGTNKRIDRFTRNILFDEKIGGTIHMALGAGFKEIGGKNESGLHWDMICDMRDGGQILVDGELFYESGEFKV